MPLISLYAHILLRWCIPCHTQVWTISRHYSEDQHMGSLLLPLISPRAHTHFAALVHPLPHASVNHQPPLQRRPAHGQPAPVPLISLRAHILLCWCIPCYTQVWIISRHYSDDQRMGSLFQRIAQEIGDRVEAAIDLTQIFRMPPQDSLKLLKACKAVLEHWYMRYMEVRAWNLSES